MAWRFCLSTVSYAAVADFPKHSLEYSLNLWSQSKKKKETCYKPDTSPRNPLQNRYKP